MTKVTEVTGSFLLCVLQLAPLSKEWFCPGPQRLSGQRGPQNSSMEGWLWHTAGIWMQRYVMKYTIKILWFGHGAWKRKKLREVKKNIKTKLSFYSGLGNATMRDFNQIGISAEWRRSWSSGDPKQFIFLWEVAAKGWEPQTDERVRLCQRRMANVNELSVSSNLTCSQQPQSPGPVWSGLRCSPHMVILCHSPRCSLPGNTLPRPHWCSPGKGWKMKRWDIESLSVSHWCHRSLSLSFSVQKPFSVKQPAVAWATAVRQRQCQESQKKRRSCSFPLFLTVRQ